ncbi:hypothetical protein BH10BDE1_BH10BDE1_15110 [soil metagenome]
MITEPNTCEAKCNCQTASLDTKLIVITGGPGAGKTAVLEMAKKVFCEHVAILPEAASIIFGGGFWRLPSDPAKSAAQRAIFQVQKEMENLVLGERKWAVGLCDRGTLDGLAYWPGSPDSFWKESTSTIDSEYARYLAVIHLRSPTVELGYNYQNPLRIESPLQAAEIDNRIAEIWKHHPRYEVIESSENFMTKAEATMKLIVRNMPAGCDHSLKKS